MQAPDTQTTIAVIGAGAMGSGIAQVAAHAGSGLADIDGDESWAELFRGP